MTTRYGARRAKSEKTVRLWIGNDPDPEDRQQIVVSQADAARIPPRGGPSRKVTKVTDLLTGRSMKLRRASCGLPNCYCAVVEAR